MDSFSIRFLKFQNLFHGYKFWNATRVRKKRKEGWKLASAQRKLQRKPEFPAQDVNPVNPSQKNSNEIWKKLKRRKNAPHRGKNPGQLWPSNRGKKWKAFSSNNCAAQKKASDENENAEKRDSGNFAYKIAKPKRTLNSNCKEDQEAAERARRGCCSSALKTQPQNMQTCHAHTADQHKSQTTKKSGRTQKSAASNKKLSISAMQIWPLGQRVMGRGYWFASGSKGTDDATPPKGKCWTTEIYEIYAAGGAQRRTPDAGRPINEESIGPAQQPRVTVDKGSLEKLKAAFRRRVIPPRSKLLIAVGNAFIANGWE